MCRHADGKQHPNIGGLYAGMSRSPAIAAVAIAIVMERSPDECLTAITTDGPHDVSPLLWSRVKTVYNQLVTNGR